MAHHVTLCVVVICDRCHVPALNPDGTAQHWPSLEQAVAELSGPPWSWSASASSQTCAACLDVLACLERDHDWGDWQTMEHLGEPGLAVRRCDRCGRDEVAPTYCLAPAPRLTLRSAS